MLCSLVRWQLSSALDREAGRPRLAAGHLARCAECRAHADRLESLHRRLAAGAAGAIPPARGQVTVSRRIGARAALVLAAGAAAAVLFLRPGASTDDASREVAERERTSAAGSPATTDDAAAPPRAERQVIGQLGRLFTAPAPLRAELHALAADGRRGALAILDLGGVRWPRRQP